MSKIAIARDADGRISAASHDTEGMTLRDFEADWFPRKVEFLEADSVRITATFSRSRDYEAEKTAAIKALLDERDELRKVIRGAADILAEVKRLSDSGKSYPEIAEELECILSTTDLAGIEAAAKKASKG